MELTDNEYEYRALTPAEHDLLARDPLAPIRRRRRLSLLVPELGGGGATYNETASGGLDITKAKELG